MTRLGAVVRLLMLFACLVPAAGPRKASAAPSPRAELPVQFPAPFAPGTEGEEEDPRQQTEEEALGKEKLRFRVSHFVVARSFTTHPPFTLSSRPAPGNTAACPAPSPADPFRNGLGCPFRC